MKLLSALPSDKFVLQNAIFILNFSKAQKKANYGT
jgi:hypothetical protein